MMNKMKKEDPSSTKKQENEAEHAERWNVEGKNPSTRTMGTRDIKMAK